MSDMTRREEELLARAENAEAKLETARTRHPFEYPNQCPLCRYEEGEKDTGHCAMHQELYRIHKANSELHTSHYKLIQGISTDNNTYWTLHLDKYERDNLLWLLTLCWYGQVEPFNFAATGDWIGQISHKLANLNSEGSALPLEADESFSPNMKKEALVSAVNYWLANKVDPEEIKRRDAVSREESRKESVYTKELREKLQATQRELEVVKKLLRDEIQGGVLGKGETS